MTPPKRPYIPKVKGCYECSQRRIDCDLTKPSCSKCKSKGLSCSGFGIRYRFCDGLVSDKKAKKRKNNSRRPPYSASTPAPGVDEYASGGVSPLHECAWSEVDSGTTSGCTKIVDGIKTPEFLYPDIFDTSCSSSFSLSNIFDEEPSQTESTRRPEACPGPTDEIYEALDLIALPDVVLIDDLQHLGDGSSAANTTNVNRSGTIHTECASRLATDPSDSGLLCRLDLGQFEPWKEFLLSYFSGNIAPEMVVVDDVYNGWRHLILPAACAHEFLMSAVLAASAFHLSSRVTGHNITFPNRLYAKAIQELQARKDLTDRDAQTRQLVILAIIVLLVAGMVNGSSDFPIMFRMLQSALDAIGGENNLADGGEMAEFSLRQIRKMRVYAAPLLSQDTGVYTLICQAQESFDCLHYYGRLYPNYSFAFGIIANLRRQAFGIYLSRVAGGLDNASTEVFDNFITTLQSFPDGSPGKHALIWPVFIAASGSRSQEHRQIFRQYLEYQCYRSGFGNLSSALELLDKIWARTDYVDWTALLPEPKVFIM